MRTSIARPRPHVAVADNAKSFFGSQMAGFGRVVEVVDDIPADARRHVQSWYLIAYVLSNQAVVHPIFFQSIRRRVVSPSFAVLVDFLRFLDGLVDADGRDSLEL